MKKIFFLLFFLLLIIGEASALKVSGRVLMNYEAGSHYEGDVCIVPEGVYEFKLESKGILAEYMKLDAKEILLEKPGCVAYEFTMPDHMRPGIQKSVIQVTEKAPKSQGNIAAVVSIGHQIWIDVPYPGKYLNVKFDVGNADSGNEVPLNARITSKGFETVNRVSGKVLIYDWENSLVGEVDMGSLQNLETQETRTLSKTWDSSGNSVGDYKAVLELEYDEISDSFDKDFKLGSLEVRLKSFTEQVYKEGIVSFNVVAESYWSQDIPNVKVHVKILDANKIVLSEFDTLTKTLNPWDSSSLTGYLDTTNLEIGEYSMEIELFYDGNSRVYEGILSIVAKPVLEKPKAKFSTTTMLLSTTIFLALIAILLALKIVFGGGKGKVDSKKEEDIPGESPPSFQKF